jgi:hypothetical protein
VPYRQDGDGSVVQVVAGDLAAAAEIDDPFPEFTREVFKGAMLGWWASNVTSSLMALTACWAASSFVVARKQ